MTSKENNNVVRKRSTGHKILFWVGAVLFGLGLIAGALLAVVAQEKNATGAEIGPAVLVILGMIAAGLVMIGLGRKKEVAAAK